MKETFEKLWGKEIPLELEQLILFQEEQSAFENYAQGFGVETSGREGLQHGWSDNPNFLGKLYPFAQANGSGSIYAIWDNGSGNPLKSLPVVVFGDEGGQWVVAQNFYEFLQLLTYDQEIYVDTACCYFYKGEESEGEESEDAEKFRNFILMMFGLPTLEEESEVATIVIDAQAEYQEAFNEWLQEFEIETPEKPTIINEEISDLHYNSSEELPRAYADEEYSDGGTYYDRDYSEMEAEFELLEFRPRLKEPYRVEQYQTFFVDLHFRTNMPLQMWVLQPKGVDGTYCPTGAFSEGTHKAESSLGFVEIPEGGRINHLRLSVAFANGQHLDAEIPFDCEILPTSHPELANDGEGTTELNGEVTLVVGGNTLRLNEPHQIPVGALVEVIVPYKTGAKQGISLWATPVKEDNQKEEPYTYYGSDSYYGPWGVAQASFEACAPFKAEFLHISSRNNFAGKPIFSTKIPMDIEFVETSGDGVGESLITSAGLCIAGEEDWLTEKATITTETDLEIHYEYKNTTQRGIYFKLYSVKNDEVQEELAQSITLTDTNINGGYVEFCIEDAQEIDDLLLVMYNTAGEVLHQRLLGLSLRVEEYDRPRKRAERPEEKPKNWFQRLFGL